MSDLYERINAISILAARSKKSTSTVVDNVRNNTPRNVDSGDHVFIVKTGFLTLGVIPDGYRVTVINKTPYGGDETIDFSRPVIVE